MEEDREEICWLCGQRMGMLDVLICERCARQMKELLLCRASYTDRGAWYVRGAEDLRWHEVSLNSDTMTLSCTCPDSQYRSSRCKHQRFLWLLSLLRWEWQGKELCANWGGYELRLSPARGDEEPGYAMRVVRGNEVISRGHKVPLWFRKTLPEV